MFEKNINDEVAVHNDTDQRTANTLTEKEPSNEVDGVQKIDNKVQKTKNNKMFISDELRFGKNCGRKIRCNKCNIVFYNLFNAEPKCFECGKIVSSKIKPVSDSYEDVDYDL